MTRSNSRVIQQWILLVASGCFGDGNNEVHEIRPARDDERAKFDWLRKQEERLQARWLRRRNVPRRLPVRDQ